MCGGVGWGAGGRAICLFYKKRQVGLSKRLPGVDIVCVQGAACLRTQAGEPDGNVLPYFAALPAPMLAPVSR